MELTFIGYAQLLIGLAIMVAGGLRHAFLFLMLSGLLGGSAAIVLPSLGGSSIPPSHFALLFVYFRILAPRGGFLGEIAPALQANRWLVLFTFYGVASAIIAPRLFAGQMHVFPMRPVAINSLFQTILLKPTSQNVTASVYLAGAMLIAVASWIACRAPRGARTLVSSTLWITWLHVATGLAALATRGTPADAVFEIFRNGAYLQLDDDVAGFVRIRGVFPEASSYAAFGFCLFVANVELWYRSVRSRATGLAALAVAAVLFFSTSSTAYVSLGAYVLFFVLRAFLLPRAADPRKIRTALATAAGSALLFALVMASMPSMGERTLDMLAQMTVEKSHTDSAAQRLFWAAQGWNVFVQSYGLGVGAGSFRSSSLFLAILGSMGVVGFFSFLLYLFEVFQPWKRSSWGRTPDSDAALGGAFASAALLSLIPAAMNSANAHPGTSFAIYAGGALALRGLRVRRGGRADGYPQAPGPALSVRVV